MCRTGWGWARMQPSHELHSKEQLPSTALTSTSPVVQSSDCSGVFHGHQLHQMAASCSLEVSVRKRCFLMCSGLPPQQPLEVFHHLQAELLSGASKRKKNPKKNPPKKPEKTALHPTGFAPQILKCVWPYTCV